MKNKDIMFLMVSIFIIVVAWTIFNVYHAAATSTVSGSLNMSISQIDPNFDTKTIDNLKKRTIVPPVYAPEAPSVTETPISTPAVVVSVTPIPMPTATSSTLTPTASQSGINQAYQEGFPNL